MERLSSVKYAMTGAAMMSQHQEVNETEYALPKYLGYADMRSFASKMSAVAIPKLKKGCDNCDLQNYLGSGSLLVRDARDAADVSERGIFRPVSALWP